MVSNSRDRNIDSSRREDARKGQVTRCEVIYVRPHVAPYPEDKDFNTVDMRMIDWPREGNAPLILDYVKLNSLLRYHGKFQGEPWTPRIGDMIYVYWLEEREALVLGLCTSIEQEPVCRSQADAHHQEYVFKLCPWEEPKTNDDKNYIEFPDPKHPECYKWWPKTRDSLHIFDCLEGHNTPSCCGQACNSLDDHQSSTCFKNFSDISPTTIDLPRRFKFLHHCGSFWYYDDDGTIHIAGKVSGSLKNQQIFYPSGKILLENVVDSCSAILDDDGDIKLNPAAKVIVDGDVEITGTCTHNACSCDNMVVQATTDPTINDDSSCGREVGCVWINTTTHKIFIAEDVTVGHAVWNQVYSPHGNWVIQEIPSGVMDGLNKIFTLAYTPINTVELYWGAGLGLAYMTYGIDYIVSDNIITLITFSPASTDLLRARYQYQRGSDNWSIQEIPSGVMDGLNKIFTLANTPAGRVEVYWGSGLGLACMVDGIDYTSSENMLTLISFAPNASNGDQLRVRYQYFE